MLAFSRITVTVSFAYSIQLHFTFLYLRTFTFSPLAAYCYVANSISIFSSSFFSSVSIASYRVTIFPTNFHPKDNGNLTLG